MIDSFFVTSVMKNSVKIKCVIIIICLASLEVLLLEVDLEYPEYLHNFHNDYPRAPECVKIGNVEKLFLNLNNRTNYVVHYENLKLYETSV